MKMEMVSTNSLGGGIPWGGGGGAGEPRAGIIYWVLFGGYASHP